MPDSPQPKLLLSRAMSALTGRGPFASHSTTDAVGHNGSDGDSPAFPLVRTLLEPPPESTGDPILTMKPPGTAVRTAVTAGRARPLGPKLWVLLRRRDALTFRPRCSSAKDSPNQLIGQGRFPFRDRLLALAEGISRRSSTGHWPTGAPRHQPPRGRPRRRPRRETAGSLVPATRGQRLGAPAGAGADPVVHVPAPAIRR